MTRKKKRQYSCCALTLQGRPCRRKMGNRIIYCGLHDRPEQYEKTNPGPSKEDFSAWHSWYCTIYGGP